MALNLSAALPPPLEPALNPVPVGPSSTFSIFVLGEKPEPPSLVEETREAFLPAERTAAMEGSPSS